MKRVLTLVAMLGGGTIAMTYTSVEPVQAQAQAKRVEQRQARVDRQFVRGVVDAQTDVHGNHAPRMFGRRSNVYQTLVSIAARYEGVTDTFV